MRIYLKIFSGSIIIIAILFAFSCDVYIGALPTSIPINSPIPPTISVPSFSPNPSLAPNATPTPFLLTDTLLLLHFNEQAGSTVFLDSSTNRNDAQCDSSNCPIPADRGIEFNGHGTYLTTAASIQGLSSFTISGWFYARSYESAGKIPINMYAPGNDCARFGLRIGGGYSEGPAVFIADNDDCQPKMVVVATEAPALNQWFHLLVIFDSESDKHSIYINGRLISENDYPLDPIPDTMPGHQMTIGVNYSPRPQDQRWWDGYIDELIIFTRALTSSEIQIIYDGTKE